MFTHHNCSGGLLAYETVKVYNCCVLWNDCWVNDILQNQKLHTHSHGSKRGLHIVQSEIYRPYARCNDDQSRKTTHKEKIEKCILIALICSQVRLICPQ